MLTGRQAGWSTAAIPPQHGRLAVITGATGGLGYETALALAAAGAEVVLAGRSAGKGAAALARIRAAHAGSAVSFELLDLASLGSVAEFADRLLAAGRGIDLLVNNAGVMAPPRRQESQDGFELQFATNYLGHFALTARLLPLLRRGSGPRVVNLSSVAAHRGALVFGDLQAVRSYVPMRAYATTKLAMLMFALELQRRSDANGWGLMSLAAHPGWARTDLFVNGPATNGRVTRLWRLALLAMPLFSQSAADGARPVLFAATSPDARGGGYYGPGGLFELKGPPAPARLPAQARNAEVAASLWEASERLSGVALDRRAEPAVAPVARSGHAA